MKRVEMTVCTRVAVQYQFEKKVSKYEFIMLNA